MSRLEYVARLRNLVRANEARGVRRGRRRVSGLGSVSRLKRLGWLRLARRRRRI